MPGGNWSKLVTVNTGDLITASERNNEFNNVIANANQDGIYSASEDLTHMQAQTDPNPGGSPALATSGRGELTGLRYIIALLSGTTYWYQHPGGVQVPLGAAVDYPSSTPPNANYVLGNGQAISRTTYATYFALVGTTFGAGDGSTTFNVPSYTDRMTIGAGNLYGVGATGGNVTHVISAGELPTHNHTINVTDPGHGHGITDPGHAHTWGGTSPSISVDNTGSTRVAIYNGSAASATSSSTTGITVNSNTTGITATSSNTGSSTAMNLLNPYIAMFKMIRVL